MPITEYEASFLALSRYSAANISTESERIREIFNGLVGSISWIQFK